MKTKAKRKTLFCFLPALLRKEDSTKYISLHGHMLESVARFLTELRIKAIGTDGLSIGGRKESVPAQGPLAKRAAALNHSLFLEKDIVIIEELTNLETILELNPNARAQVFFAPIALLGAKAAPCRAYAIVDS